MRLLSVREGGRRTRTETHRKDHRKSTEHRYQSHYEIRENKLENLHATREAPRPDTERLTDCLVIRFMVGDCSLSVCVLHQINMHSPGNLQTSTSDTKPKHITELLHIVLVK